MAQRRCEVCGNEYDKTFQVILQAGRSHTFDSFECAIQALAPTCENCSVRIVGHGVESDNHMYCCAHCAHQKGVPAVKDRA
jgi:hypothetical protein